MKSPSKVYILQDADTLAERWQELRRKEAGLVDWDLEETKRKLLAFFGGERQEPGSGAARGSGEADGVNGQ